MELVDRAEDRRAAGVPQEALEELLTGGGQDRAVQVAPRPSVEEVGLRKTPSGDEVPGPFGLDGNPRELGKRRDSVRGFKEKPLKRTEQSGDRLKVGRHQSDV